MSVTRTLLLGASRTDIRSLDGMRVHKLHLRAPGLRKGDDDDIPGRQGLLPADGLVYAAYSFSAEVRIFGDTPEELEDNLSAIQDVIVGLAGDGLLPLGRRLPQTAGPGYFDEYANGRFHDGFALNMLNHVTGLTELQFVNLSGAWTPGDPDDLGATWRL